MCGRKGGRKEGREEQREGQTDKKLLNTVKIKELCVATGFNMGNSHDYESNGRKARYKRIHTV